MSQRWKNSHRSVKRFKANYDKWLERHLIFDRNVNEDQVPSTSTGRPRLSYDNKSVRSQKREASALLKKMDKDLNVTVLATSTLAWKRGKRDLAMLLKETTKSPELAKKIKTEMFTCPKKQLTPFSLNEALAFFYENNLSKRQYTNMRLQNIARNCDVYPTYTDIVEAKKSCIPLGVEVTEKIAKVSLKNILQHTIERIVLLQEPVIDRVISITNDDVIECEFTFSYGFDGSSGQSIYKQRFKESQDSAGTDSSIFATTIVPLRFVTNNNIILWNNNMPTSVGFCRPLKLQLVKETEDEILREKGDIDNQINNLSHFRIIHKNKTLTIKLNLIMALIDGKVLNVLTNNKSSQSCPICGATPRQMLTISNFQSKEFQPKENEHLKYGFSPLHAWIRFFECVLHISYRLTVKKWRIKQKQDKEKLRIRKKEVQTLFWEKLSLNVDKPKPGSGNTNDGNTVRRAFRDTKILGEITGVDINLLQKMKIILITISSQFPINLEKFQIFCFGTAELFMEKYSWYPMPPTVHKIFIHGKQILEQCILPPGYLREDAAESKNKYYKYDRAHHARQNSRTNNLHDVFHRAMGTSDPFISTIILNNRRQQEYRKKLNLPSEVLALLCSPSIEEKPSASVSSTN